MPVAVISSVCPEEEEEEEEEEERCVYVQYIISQGIKKGWRWRRKRTSNSIMYNIFSFPLFPASNRGFIIA